MKKEKMIPMTFRIPRELHRLLRIRAAEQERTIQELAGEILRAALEGAR